MAAAAARAAEILAASRCPVVCGLDTDVAGIEAAVMLARRLGAALDHGDPAALRHVELMRRDGCIVTTKLQARARADLLMFVGPGIAEAWPGFAERLALHAPPPLAPDRPRRIAAIGPDAATAGAAAAAETVDASPADLPRIVGALSALVAGRRLRAGFADRAALERCAAMLADARYGVVLWSTQLPILAAEALVAMIDEVNRTTRCAGLPLGGAETAVQATAWLTGFPPGTSFARGFAEHDPWRFSARRMVESGEADAALWIGGAVPDWAGRLPTVALAPAGTAFATPPAVAIAVGEPGVDHDAIAYHPDLDILAARPAARPSDVPAAGEVLRRIAAALPC